MEQEATCSICLEIFTDPVSLPCGHGFCRNCLKTLVDHSSRTNKGENASSGQEILYCSLCREEVKLGHGGVDELSPSQSLAELAEKCRVTRDCTTTVPLCDMCEGDKKNADKYCVNCAGLYCRECLDALHPQRGPLGRHRLISMEEYLSQTSPNVAVASTVSRPLCDMCESDNQNANNYCVNCMTLYCQQCLSAYHPQRGHLGRHHLISMEEYLSQKSLGPAVSSEETDREVANCQDHREPLILFCGTCDRPICTKCISQHNNHVMLDISKAYNNKKGPMEDKVRSSRETKSSIQEIQTQLIAAQKDVQTKMDHEIEQIEATYETCLKELNDWRTMERGKVEEKRDTLTKEALLMLKQISHQIEETELLITSSMQLLSGSEAVFLKNSADLGARIKSNAEDSARQLENKKLQLSELRSALSEFSYTPCSLTIPRLSGDQSAVADTQVLSGAPSRSPLADISFPRLGFTESTIPEAVSIVDDGAEVREKHGRVLWNCVRTDGLLVTGRYYWEVAVTWSVSSPPAFSGWCHVITVGVRQDGADFTGWPGCDPQSYGVVIYYRKDPQQHRFVCYHQWEEEHESTPQSCNLGPVTQTLGFLLDVPQGTLTVVDVDGGKVLHTFGNIQTSRPLVPVVWFGDYYFHKSFRLRPCDQPSLSEPVRAILYSEP